MRASSIPLGAAPPSPLWRRSAPWLSAFVLLALVGLAGLVDLPFAPKLCSLALAESASTAPHTGMEGGMGRAYGPDASEDSRRSGRNVPQTSMPLDAYGNPITGEMQEAPPRVRPRPGAYGGHRPSAPAGGGRPLPEPPAKPQWSFK